MSQHEKINYVEFPASDIKAAKIFFEKVFGWTFTDYGPDYTSFSNSGVNGGFFKSDTFSSTRNGSALIVLFSENITGTRQKVIQNGGTIIKPLFSFPGGRRFHFSDPNRNEFAVWTDSK